MLDINILTDMVITLKVIESSNNYKQISDENKEIYEIYFRNSLKENLEFKQAQELVCRYLESKILIYLKEVI